MNLSVDFFSLDARFDEIDRQRTRILKSKNSEFMQIEQQINSIQLEHVSNRIEDFRQNLLKFLIVDRNKDLASSNKPLKHLKDMAIKFNIAAIGQLKLKNELSLQKKIYYINLINFKNEYNFIEFSNENELIEVSLISPQVTRISIKKLKFTKYFKTNLKNLYSVKI